MRKNRAWAKITKSKWLLKERSKGQNQELEMIIQLMYANNKQPIATGGLNLTPTWIQ